MTSIMLREGALWWDGAEVETYSYPFGHLRGQYSKQETETPTAMAQEVLEQLWRTRQVLWLRQSEQVG